MVAGWKGDLGQINQGPELCRRIVDLASEVAGLLRFAVLVEYNALHSKETFRQALLATHRD